MKIKKASLSDLNQLTLLFDGYRMFYKQESDLEVARSFINERFLKKDSVIFIAFDKEDLAIGFTQLYPTFSSVSMKKSFILNDLYVEPKMRGKGVGEALLTFAKEFSTKKNCKCLTLETATDNPAQKLYERLGWKKDIDVLHYTWKV